MHVFWKYITDSSLNFVCVGIFNQAQFVVVVMKPTEILRTRTKDK